MRCCPGIWRNETLFHSYSCPNRATVPRWWLLWAKFRNGFYEWLGIVAAFGLIVLIVKVWP